MAREELIQLRMNMLGGMNAYVLEQIGDENIINYWQQEAVPDCADENDLMDIAEDDELWTHVCFVFGFCAKAEVEESEEY